MPLNVFYLDDELDLLDIFKEVFESTDVHIFTFNEAQKLLEAVKVSPPDIIFFDYRMPGKNGDEVAQQISATIPKVLISGDMQVECKSTFIAKLTKPLNFEDVERILQTLK